MYEAYLEINGVRTKVTSFGKWVEESCNDTEDIVIIIPGNPGVNGFYNTFANKIHEKLGYSVWIIGHAGHNLPKQRINPYPPLEANADLYGLKGQIQNKVEFLEKYITKNSRIHFIGHSIGAYMVLELLENTAIKDKVVDAYLLFPTVEHMAKTSAGKFLVNFVKPIVWLIIFLSWIFTILPGLVQILLLNIYMSLTGLSISEHRSTIRSFIKPAVLKRVFFLAYQEMNQVNERNNEVIKKNVDKIRFYYGQNDGWAPLSYYNTLKKAIPNVDAQISQYNHAFVMKQGVEVANVVSDWIKAKQ